MRKSNLFGDWYLRIFLYKKGGNDGNKMAVVPLKKLFLKMGLPMIISMVLQALYNVIDSIFITNMGSDGVIANQALTLAFPIQLLIIAIGVGTGVGINALLSKSLGEQNKDKVNKIAGTGIFLSICIYVVFLVFGLKFVVVFLMVLLVLPSMKDFYNQQVKHTFQQLLKYQEHLQILF